MKILYGVPGEGMGHATRSKVIISYLLSQGHEVHIVASSRAYTFLSKEFPGKVTEITGFHLSYKNTGISLPGSIWINLKRAHQLYGSNLLLLLKLHQQFKADKVISDFESLSHLYAWLFNVSVISIDNIQVNYRCELSIEIPSSQQFNYWLAKEITASKVPATSHYLISSFFNARCLEPNTQLVPPIIREVIEKANPCYGEAVVMYQTSASIENVEKVLFQFPEQKFIIYGLNRDSQYHNCTFKPFSEEGFIQDLAQAKAVIANGGFSFISEAVYLKKPIYSFPIKGQFEQYINAAYVSKLGYGKQALDLNTADLSDFLNKLPQYQTRLADYHQNGNTELFETLNKLLLS